MIPVKRIEGTASALLTDNVSTDIISPSELYLKPRSAYGPGLFAPWRYLADGSENPDFPLNRPGHRDTSILLVGENFGCGSSREIAVWCLQDYGIRCVIGPSFGDIFFENALKSGLVAVLLDARLIADLAGRIESAGKPVLTVDIEAMRIADPSGESVGFEMDPFRRAVHLEGVEEFDMVVRETAAIEAHQRHTRASMPWLLPPHPRTQNSGAEPT